MNRSPELQKVVKQLKEEADNAVFIDVGKGKELALGISRTRLNLAVNVILESDQYVRYYVRTTQHGTGKTVTIEALCTKGTAYKDVSDALTAAVVQ